MYVLIQDRSVWFNFFLLCKTKFDENVLKIEISTDDGFVVVRTRTVQFYREWNSISIVDEIFDLLYS